MQTPSSPDLAALQPSWELSLRADRKSPSTIENYTIGLRLYLRWWDAHGHEPAIDRKLVQAFVVDLLDQGVQPATARARLAALKRLSAWLVEEDELEIDPLLGMRPPKADRKVTERLTDDELRALVAACKGLPRSTGDPERVPPTGHHGGAGSCSATGTALGGEWTMASQQRTSQAHTAPATPGSEGVGGSKVKSRQPARSCQDRVIYPFISERRGSS